MDKSLFTVGRIRLLRDDFAARTGVTPRYLTVAPRNRADAAIAAIALGLILEVATNCPPDMAYIGADLLSGEGTPQ